MILFLLKLSKCVFVAFHLLLIVFNRRIIIEREKWKNSKIPVAHITLLSSSIISAAEVMIRD